MSQSTPPRSNFPLSPQITFSPTSVVWEDPPLVDPFVDHGEGSFVLPSLSQVQSGLQKLVIQSAHSKAAYRAKLGKLASDLHEANTSVKILEKELRTARDRQTAAQQAMNEAKQRREEEAERLSLRRLQLQLMSRCMVDTDFLMEIQHIRDNEIENHETKYINLSSLELSIMRKRLEEIRDMLDKADAKKSCETLRREAVSKFVLLHKFSQI
jgi:outer membrane murein-binding lipoprotein Lpp